jgi:transketolase
MRKAFFDTLLESAKNDSRIYLISADVGYGQMDRFRKELPNQFINAGISEQHAISMAAGMAVEGLRPFVCSMTPFLILKGLEQIKLDILMNESPVVLVGIGVDDDYKSSGETHMCREDIKLMDAIGYPKDWIITIDNKEEAGRIAKDIAEGAGPFYIRLRRREI